MAWKGEQNNLMSPHYPKKPVCDIGILLRIQASKHQNVDFY